MRRFLVIFLTSAYYHISTEYVLHGYCLHPGQHASAANEDPYIRMLDKITERANIEGLVGADKREFVNEHMGRWKEMEMEKELMDSEAERQPSKLNHFVKHKSLNKAERLKHDSSS